MGMRRSCWLSLIALALAAAPGPDDPFLRWMNTIAQRELQQREDAVARIHTVADAEQRKMAVRAKILDALGGLPDYAGPLNARVTGTLHADGYAIDKLIYESLPGYYVTANLYRPTQPGRYPAVLFQAGHTQEGKVEPQLLAANLALKGFIVLAFDPVGQGEREQTWDPLISAPAAGWSVIEHIQQGAQAQLVGEGLARYFIWDAKRSIDYLVSRQDVDASRIGAAGCSGGGALTTFIGALDPRIKAVIPACFPISYRILFTGEDPHGEMILPGELARGLDTADFVELSAPTPWLIEATEHDFFPPAGAKLVYEEAKRWFGIYGAGDHVAFFVGTGPHGTPLASREAIYEWLIRWLKAGAGDAKEQPINQFSPHQLLVTRTGHVEDEPGSRKLYELIRDDLRARAKAGTTAELQAELRRLRIPTDGSPPAVSIVSRAGQSERILLDSEPGIELDGELFVPPGPGRKPAVLVIAGERADWQARTFAAAGCVVLKLEPRRSPASEDHRPWVGDWMANIRADQIGLNLPAMRAHDILRGVDYLASRADVDPRSIRATARGVRGIWLLLAAAADPRMSRIWLDRTPINLRAALDSPLSTDLYDAVIPGFILHWDLDDLRIAMGPRPILWTDPSDWMERVVDAGPRFSYRYSPGDLTDMADDQDRAFAAELLK